MKRSFAFAAFLIGLLLAVTVPLASSLTLIRSDGSKVDLESSKEPLETTTGAGSFMPPALPSSEVFQFSSNPTFRLWKQMAANPDASPQEIGGYVYDLFHDLGYQIPPSSVDEVNESSTLSFTYPLGDIDGDGRDDVGFDVFCVDIDVCTELQGVENTLYPVCAWRHWFEARSGATGEVIWDHPLDTPYPLPVWRLGCSLQFVVGTVPAEGGLRNILVYRWEALFAQVATVLHHETYLLDARGQEKEGKVLWMDEDDGVCTANSCVNMVVRPLLYTLPRQGNPILPSEMKSGLFLRGIGFVFWYATCGNLCKYPWVIDPVLDHYASLEWAASLDLATGTRQWEVDTFQPQLDRSLFPDTYPGKFPAWFPMFEWTQEACCWDQTGDGAPDLIYTTYEWSPLQAVHATGPDTWDSHVVLFDGKTGDKVYTIETAKDVTSLIFYPWLVPLGDVNGDGASDYYHGQSVQVAIGDKPQITVRIYNGKDGQVLWKLEGDKFFDILVLGDADGDGGNDFLLAYYELGSIGHGLYDVSDTRLVVHNGATGKILWETQTFTAPIDLFAMFWNARLNGLPDFTGDGVGDVWLDRPKQMDDLTVVHNATFLSGQDGTALFTVTSVGAFAFPIGAKDLDGDGGNDFTITQGDIVDLWITAHNGRTGDPLWSRRLMAIPQSGVTQSIPILQYHSMELDGNTTKSDLLLSFTMYTFSLGGGRATRSFYQQHQGIQGPLGPLQWAVPALDEEDPDVSLHIGAPTPATQQYVGWNQPTLDTSAAARSLFSISVVTGMGLTAVGSLLGGFLMVRRRLKG